MRDTTHLLCLLKPKCEVVSAVFWLQRIPIKALRIEDMNESTECQTVIPTCWEVGHWNLFNSRVSISYYVLLLLSAMYCDLHKTTYRIVFYPVLNPHQDHFFCTRTWPGCYCSWRGCWTSYIGSWWGRQRRIAEQICSSDRSRRGSRCTRRIFSFSSLYIF